MIRVFRVNGTVSCRAPGATPILEASSLADLARLARRVDDGRVLTPREAQTLLHAASALDDSSSDVEITLAGGGDLYRVERAPANRLAAPPKADEGRWVTSVPGAPILLVDSSRPWLEALKGALEFVGFESVHAHVFDPAKPEDLEASLQLSSAVLVGLGSAPILSGLARAVATARPGVVVVGLVRDPGAFADGSHGVDKFIAMPPRIENLARVVDSLVGAMRARG